MRKWLAAAVVVTLTLASSAAIPAALASEDDGGDDDGHLIGVVEVLPDSPDLVGDWMVSGVLVHVTPSTEIDEDDAAISLGATVKVEGRIETDGSITAHEIEATEDAEDDDYGEMKVQGFVEALPSTPDLVGDWMVSGTVVHVTTATKIEQEHGAVAIGSAVEVEGVAEADGAITAREIEVKDPSDVEEDWVVFRGEATRYPDDLVGTWKVSKHEVRVRPATRIAHERRLDRGSIVRVSGRLRADGSIRASKVVVRT